MTPSWTELWRYFVHVMRIRFAKQHMCDACGDALVPRLPGGMDGSRFVNWECEACEEERERRRADERLRAQLLTPLEKAAQQERERLFIEALRAQQNAALASSLGLSGLNAALGNAQYANSPAHGAIGGFLSGAIGKITNS